MDNNSIYYRVNSNVNPESILYFELSTYKAAEWARRIANLPLSPLWREELAKENPIVQVI